MSKKYRRDIILANNLGKQHIKFFEVDDTTKIPTHSVLRLEIWDNIEQAQPTRNVKSPMTMSSVDNGAKKKYSSDRENYDKEMKDTPEKKEKIKVEFEINDGWQDPLEPKQMSDDL